MRVLVVAAHPDDETIGLGGQFPRLCDLILWHVTDGAPRNGRDAATQGFATRGAYAEARRRELAAALRLAGRDPSCARSLGIPDQEAAYHLPEIAHGVAQAIRSTRPAVVVTHPYEGGHPDHDATAFGVHAALHLLRRVGEATPPLLEMTSYHAGPQGIAVGRFLPAEGCMPTLLPLSDEAREHKRRMLACFATQQAMLRYFPATEVEPLRVAPAYDFCVPPHPGTLFYEGFDWGMTGAHFRALAARSGAALGLGSAPWG